VALLEFDLRRPKLRVRFNLEKRGPGISTVLIGKDKPENVYLTVFEDGTLHLFPSGPVPPNPSELMAGDYMNEFKKYLDEHYDVVVIDTPPYGIVADAQLMQSWANICLVVTRFRMTIREQVHEIEEWNRTKLFKNLALIFNGIRTKGYYGYKYGYYYTKRRYGSPYYYRDEKEEKLEDAKGEKGDV
jgi:Mrp family chromosome partitioning ATPase